MLLVSPSWSMCSYPYTRVPNTNYYFLYTCSHWCCYHGIKQTSTVFHEYYQLDIATWSIWLSKYLTSQQSNGTIPHVEVIPFPFTFWTHFNSSIPRSLDGRMISIISFILFYFLVDLLLQPILNGDIIQLIWNCRF